MPMRLVQKRRTSPAVCGSNDVLDQADGDVRRVQKFSRHKNLDTAITYGDNRIDVQYEIRALLDS